MKIFGYLALTILMVTFNSSALGAGADVQGQTVGYVYQFNSSDSTMFDVHVPTRTHECGSSLYRSTSTSDAIADRKFALILAAFTSNKKISFRETGVCDGNRMKISWVRITN